MNSDNVLYDTNSFQTPITQGLKDSIHPEVYANLMEFIHTVEFVKNLVSPDRPRIKDLKKVKGKIVVDLENPHVLEDMDFFVKTRDAYLEQGYYTSAKFSKDPKSDYRKFWDEEERRSLEGHVNKKTGEWIPGYLYFYWNFGRILKTTEAKGAEMVNGKIRSDRGEYFPDIWEIDYFYFHYIDQAEQSGLYGALLKCRGVGASFKAACMAIRNFFLIRKSKTFIMAYSDGYLYDDGLMNKITDMESFMQIKTAFRKRKITSTPKKYLSGYKDKSNNNTQTGYLSEITGVNTKNPDAGRGKRGKLIVHEEFGSHKSGLDVWRVCDRSLDDRGNVFGFQLAQGTGGDDQSDFQALVRLFFKPKAFKIKHLRNVFDKNAASTTSAFFIGDYMNRPRSYNKNGVTNVVKNLIDIFEERRLIELELDDADEIAKKKAEGAITPLEAITVMEGSVMPKELAKEAIAELSSDYENRTRGFHYVRFSRVGEDVRTIHSADYTPITEYPYTGNRPHMAAVTIKKLPKKHADGTIPHFRYIMGIDTIEDDENLKGSLFSFQVMDLWTDDIVCWYIGRHVIVEDDYELAMATCMLYNATANYESNLKGLYAFFKNNMALRYLANTPDILVEKELLKRKGTVGNRLKGTRATAPINAWGLRLQAKWLRTEHTYYAGKLGIETVDDIEYLREVSLHDPVGNYDKLSAGNMLFIYREDLVKVTDSNKNSNLNTSEDYNSDNFFDESGSDIDNFISLSDELDEF